MNHEHLKMCPRLFITSRSFRWNKRFFMTKRFGPIAISVYFSRCGRVISLARCFILNLNMNDLLVTSEHILKFKLKLKLLSFLLFLLRLCASRFGFRLMFSWCPSRFTQFTPIYLEITILRIVTLATASTSMHYNSFLLVLCFMLFIFLAKLFSVCYINGQAFRTEVSEPLLTCII